MPNTYPPIDLMQLFSSMELDMELVFSYLQSLYDSVDEMLQTTTEPLNLPCKRGCSMCCHESVFLTPLEFFYIWNYVQSELTEDERNTIIRNGLHIYQDNQALIESLEDPPPEGENDHFSIAKELKFACPLLNPDGACTVYPVRELYARLFGGSFEKSGDVYGCHLVREHLFGQEVTLLTAHDIAQYLDEFPLTHKRQVYPYYIQQLYGE